MLEQLIKFFKTAPLDEVTELLRSYNIEFEEDSYNLKESIKGDNKMTVKHVVSKTKGDLQRQINDIISEPDCTLVDIKYSSSDRGFSALVICQNYYHGGTKS